MSSFHAGSTSRSRMFWLADSVTGMPYCSITPRSAFFASPLMRPFCRQQQQDNKGSVMQGEGARTVHQSKHHLRGARSATSQHLQRLLVYCLCDAQCHCDAPKPLGPYFDTHTRPPTCLPKQNYSSTAGALPTWMCTPYHSCHLPARTSLGSPGPNCSTTSIPAPIRLPPHHPDRQCPAPNTHLRP